MSLSVRREGSGWTLGVPTALVATRTAHTQIQQYQYDVAPDGRRFIVAAENAGRVIP